MLAIGVRNSCETLTINSRRLWSARSAFARSSSARVFACASRMLVSLIFLFLFLLLPACAATGVFHLVPLHGDRSVQSSAARSIVSCSAIGTLPGARLGRHLEITG